MIKAVIYDMDGVIIDSEPLWREALIHCFNKVGFDFTQDKCRVTQGMRLIEVVEYWYAQQPWEGKSIEEVEQNILTKVTELISEKGTAMEGVHESISLFKAKGYKIALASSSASSLINVVLDKLNIRDEFEVVNSAEFLKLGKPHPEVFIKTAEDLNVPAINCLVIEDSFHGVLAAKAAVMQVIAVPEEKYHNDPRFSIAEYNLKSLKELKDLTFE
ncbi:MAG: hexitol phosphatase HxpB [Flavobacteriales bacterium]|tara:strand:- start:5832 stop:6479 length:648 start_codon:yes stop_codon:yes gene_type:complete